LGFCTKTNIVCIIKTLELNALIFGTEYGKYEGMSSAKLKNYSYQDALTIPVHLSSNKVGLKYPRLLCHTFATAIFELLPYSQSRSLFGYGWDAKELKTEIQISLKYFYFLYKRLVLVILSYIYIYKGKAALLQAWIGPEDSRKLLFTDFMTTAQDSGKVVSLTHRPPLPPGNAPGIHFC